MPNRFHVARFGRAQPMLRQGIWRLVRNLRIERGRGSNLERLRVKLFCSQRIGAITQSAWHIVKQIAGVGRVLVFRNALFLVWRSHSQLLPRRPRDTADANGQRALSPALYRQNAAKTGMMNDFNATQQWAGIVGLCAPSKRPSPSPHSELSAARIMRLVDRL